MMNRPRYPGLRIAVMSLWGPFVSCVSPPPGSPLPASPRGISPGRPISPPRPILLLSILWRHEHVADPAHGADRLGMGRIDLDLAAQPGDAQIDRPVER